jgi:hypothetical protein
MKPNSATGWSWPCTYTDVVADEREFDLGALT